ncbi:hypothetical protein [Kineococcus sp. R86509]|uniref:hypothetical protein n=1 Tax=Kineococcus sp. R86509 TaxID=3093851 RepID=UPI0036D369C7
MPRTPDDGSGPLDVDAAFALIVAHWGEEATSRTDTPAGDTTPAADEDDAQAGEAPRPEPRLVRPVTPLPPPPHEDVPTPEWFATPRRRDDEPVELRSSSEERFVPAEPQPLPRDLLGWAAWIAVVGAPLFLLVVALGWNDVPQLVTAITAGVFVAGFATLVIRLPGSRDDDDDDGAVV